MNLITTQPQQVHDLLNTIREAAWLSYSQRDELLSLIQRGQVEAASGLLNAWRPNG